VSPLAIPLALVVDAVMGEPPNGAHPVVWIGRAASWLEQQGPEGSLARLVYGAFLTTTVAGGAALAGAGASRVAKRLPWPLGLLLEAWVLKTTLSVRALVDAGKLVESHLEADDLEGARRAVTALVSRDPHALSAPLLVSAAVESLAENTADSIVAPLWYYSIGGLPAALAYRAVNTLDAMIGYHGRYEQLGKAAARFDDLLNLVPARLSSALLLVGGALAGGDVATGLEITRRDHGETASPNAGWPMSTMAGLLAVRLEKPDHYRLGAELPTPDLAAIDHAAEIIKAATVLTVPVMLGVRWLCRALRR
jgi:adenosylcobinamide-phosphate synthase